jgi:hypothetical protein
MKTPMKTVLLLSFVLLAIAANAKNYYLSNSGNDSNSGTDPSSAWQTLTKINATTFLPGDQILFRRGDTFYGNIVVNISGTSSTPITYGSYGSGAKPVITGFTSVTSWTNKGGNIWESTNPVSTLPDLKTVLINGQSVPMGRYPNADASYPFLPNFFNFQSHTGTGAGNSSITSSSLSGGNNWTGADVVIRMNQWTFHREVITGQSATTLTFNGVAGSLEDGWGFFIQNDIRTLDQQNEWYYNPSTKKLSVYSTTQPTNVQVSTIDMLLNFYSNVPTVTSVNVDNLKFTGANTNGIWISGNLTFSVTNCDISYCGLEGMVLNGGGIKSGTISGDTFTNNGSSGIYSSGDVQNLTITKNSIAVSGIISAYKQNDYTNGGMTIYGPNSLIQYNTVDSSAYCGIQFKGANVQVRNNFVNHSALIRGDAGGIYTGFINETGKVIDGNIVLNSEGNPRGSRGNDYFAMGIYIDDLGNNLSVTNNTIANCRTAGLYLHNSNNLFIRNNTIYNCGALGTEIMWANGGMSMDGNGNQFSNSVYNNQVLNNIVFATNQYQYALNYYAESGGGNQVSNFGTIDSNYYVKVNSSSTAIKSQQNNINGNMSLSGWQSATGKDASSKECVKTITDLNDVRFEYNNTTQIKTISLDANYIDVKGNPFNGSITLQPYSSCVLIKNGSLKTNLAPSANAGSDQTITLPVNTISLSATASDSDGTIASFLWTKIAGPNAGTIADSSSASTTVKGLIQGNYIFKLTVTDNQGATGADSVLVTVNAAPNLAPTANAGADKTITLPTNSVSLSGSGTDTDGSISSYSWTKISGPSAYSIVSSSSAVTTVSGLVQGTYEFELKVTDNNGAIGRDTVQLTVNAANNIAPKANAGPDNVINLPVNSVILSGSGTDIDGTISSYSWTKISGPSAFNIVSSSAAVTTVSGLVQGTYQFELKVTDNNGAIGKDTVQLTVNAAPNLAPTANAGADKTITLPTNSVSLSGSGTDSDGSIPSYSWTKISGPSAFNIVSSSSAVTTVSGLVQGTYQFELKVTDNNGAIGRDTVQLTVNTAPNLAPTANAGADKTITLPTNSVSLSGNGTDSDGSISSYSWTKISGPSAFNITSSSSAVTNVSGLVQGTYQFELKVTDNNGAIGKDTVQVTVNAAPNLAPTANAGADKTITLPTNSVSLSGNGTDSDGSISSYSWTKISGPSAFNIVSSSSAVTTVSGLVQGTYQFELKVTDNNGAIGKDTVQLTVNAANNIAPKANAGPDNVINLPVNSVILSGSGTDIDGTIAAYSWTKIFGSSAFTIKNSSSATSEVSGLTEGIYRFELKVTDNNGAVGKDTIQVTVNAPKNLSPTAQAGSDQSITLPANTINLNGSGVDSDGSITSYSWTKISGPSAYNIANPSLAVTSVANLVEGIYQFELKVTDDKGAIGTDTIQVTVNKSNITVIAPTPNIAPVANAGNDTTALSPVNSVVLNGSGNDIDGKITGYLWTQLSGPSTSSILPNNTASTTVSGLIGGTYQFELKVTDNAGAEAKDTVKVTIALARTAQQTSTGLKVYPNPVHNIANVELNTQVDNARVTIRISDILGNTVYQEEFVSTTKDVKKQIDFSSLRKGTYLVSALVNGVVKESMKVVKM